MTTKIRLNPRRLGPPLVLSLALTAGTSVASASTALAQTTPDEHAAAQNAALMPDSQPLTGTLPDAWDSAWDNNATHDRLHYVIGTVASFSPYRLLVARSSGETTRIDLKPGTIIRPTGLNLSPGEHVAVIGYWSKGTFIAIGSSCVKHRRSR